MLAGNPQISTKPLCFELVSLSFLLYSLFSGGQGKERSWRLPQFWRINRAQRLNMSVCTVIGGNDVGTKTAREAQSSTTFFWENSSKTVPMSHLPKLFYCGRHFQASVLSVNSAEMDGFPDWKAVENASCRIFNGKLLYPTFPGPSLKKHRHVVGLLTRLLAM